MCVPSSSLPPQKAWSLLKCAALKSSGEADGRDESDTPGALTGAETPGVLVNAPAGLEATPMPDAAASDAFVSEAATPAEMPAMPVAPPPVEEEEKEWGGGC